MARKPTGVYLHQKQPGGLIFVCTSTKVMPASVWFSVSSRMIAKVATSVRQSKDNHFTQSHMTRFIFDCTTNVDENAIDPNHRQLIQKLHWPGKRCMKRKAAQPNHNEWDKGSYVTEFHSLGMSIDTINATHHNAQWCQRVSKFSNVKGDHIVPFTPIHWSSFGTPKSWCLISIPILWPTEHHQAKHGKG